MTIKNFVTFPDRVTFWYPYSSTSMERCLRRVVPAAVATTQVKPHAQQQVARDLEVERAGMGQRRRPQSFGDVQRGNPQPWRWLGFLLCIAALLLYSCSKSRIRACDLIHTSHTGGAALSCFRPPISEGHPISMVCSRSRVRLYAAALRSGPGLLCAAARFVSAQQQR